MSVATLPPPQEIKNDDGTTTTILYRVNDAGKRVKVTRRVRIEEVPVSTPDERYDWQRYGEAVRDTVKPQKGDEIVLRLYPKSATPAKEDAAPEKKAPSLRVKCKFCGGDHLSYQCPIKDKLAKSQPDVVNPSPMDAPMGGVGGGRYVPPSLRSGSAPGIPGSVQGKYVPPSLRGAPGINLPGMQTQQERDEASTLRISNLPDTIQEADLRANFGRVGRIVRCHVARSKQTGRGRGFAFMVFESPNTAERARQLFDGKPVNNMIMHVDFAQPRQP